MASSPGQGPGGPWNHTTSNFVRADDLERRMDAKSEQNSLVAEKQQSNRWPTLFEILNRKTQSPVDLWSFYVYMRDGQKNIDYLDFWIDTVQHMGLCKAYVKGLKQSLLLNERIRSADQVVESMSPPRNPVSAKRNSSGSRESRSSSMLLDLLMRNNLLEEFDSRRMSAFLRGESSVRSSDPQIHAKIDQLKRKSHSSADDPLDVPKTPVSSKRVSTINPQMLETMIQEDSEQSNKSFKDSHFVTREKLAQSANNIVHTYFLHSSPKKIVIPPEMINSVVRSVQMDARDDPEIFDESREFVFKAMEHEAYPNFLRYHALSNVTSRSAIYRLFGSLLAGLGAFWTGYTLIFLDYQPKIIRWVVISLGYRSDVDGGCVNLHGRLLRVFDWVGVVFLEVRMEKSSFGTDSSRRVVGQQLLQEVDAVGVQVWHRIGQVLLGPFREARLEVAQIGNVGPDLLGWGSQNTEDLEDLVDLRVSGKQRLAVGHLCKNASNRPHIHACRVLFTTKQDLWTSVPQSDNLVSVRTQRDAKRSGKTEISNLEVTFLVDQQILRLQVSV
ncbi:hypothetical protein OGAPHI_002483 [Ogataea philodendri]|uniref:RGS domain-containing protein n=1 Tax=Ogataea philodendri TaxID=1378263 RepID=A0A9P8PCG9_9ASCO|nr:uncharacterized protein OGAPHI_002483 [Ogataea philodendri]KAH3668729.1 hypothetical protein OGAPHI_002483 [Ogataea philodendri]